MKISIKYAFFFLVLSLFLEGCKDPITDFGYDAVLKGTVTDQDGDIVSGDITSNENVIRILGELDDAPLTLPLKEDGTYQNTKLYPQSYTVWLEGPFVESPTTEVEIDLEEEKEVTHDFVVTPFIDSMPPELVGSPSESISVNFSVSGNAGHVADFVTVLASTVSYPSITTGSGAGYTTLTQTVSNEDESGNFEGTVDFSGLESGQRYFIRIAARAQGESAYNYSDQIRVEIP